MFSATGNRLEEVEKTMKVPTKKNHENAIVPKYQSKHAAGLDLCSVYPYTIFPGERRTVSIGLAFAIPVGYSGSIRPRSGLASERGITVLNSPGCLDADFRGEVKVVLINHGDEVFSIVPGDRIAQLVFERVEQAELEVVEELDATERGAGGFGSTGR